MHIYIQRERERERESTNLCLHCCYLLILVYQVLEVKDGMVYGSVSNNLQVIDWPVGKVIHFPPQAINTINIPHSLLGQPVHGASNPPMPNINELSAQQGAYFIGNAYSSTSKDHDLLHTIIVMTIIYMYTILSLLCSVCTCQATFRPRRHY